MTTSLSNIIKYDKFKEYSTSYKVIVLAELMLNYQDVKLFADCVGWVPLLEYSGGLWIWKHTVLKLQILEGSYSIFFKDELIKREPVPTYTICPDDILKFSYSIS